VRRVVLESPYSAKSEWELRRNVEYLRLCLRDSLMRGEAPFASHGIYTLPGVLDDDIPSERLRGILAGFEWRSSAEATVVYQDFGVTPGMQYGIDHAHELSHVVERRNLYGVSAISLGE
jgi:hypothetical protein